MSAFTTRPIKEINKVEFKEMLSGKELVISPHAYNHLCTRQRKVFKDKELTGMIEKESPRKIYLQKNRRYAVYYRKKDGYRKVIMGLEGSKAVIISFFDPPELPKIKL